MKTIVVVNKPLTSLASGYDLRVWHLCASLLRADHALSLVVVPLGSREAAELADGTIDARELFREVTEIDDRWLAAPAVGRHFRVNEKDHLRLAFPRFFHDAVAAVRTASDRHAAERMVFFGENLAGLAAAFPGRSTILDVCDSVVLTLRREPLSTDRPDLKRLVRRRVALLRWGRLERRLPQLVRLVTTISEPDSETIRRLARAPCKVVTVPNGVDPALESWWERPGSRRRGVVFWGNLSFAPNREAVRRFHDRIYRPWLASRGVEWCIVGRNPEPWLREEAERNPGIRLTGFVRDLYPLVSEYPVMVNPLYSGSGLKNKALEAFALGMAVVSTHMGIEAISGAEADTHFLLAKNDKMFAEQVLCLLDDELRRDELAANARRLVTSRYTWSAVGHQWRVLCEELA